MFDQPSLVAKREPAHSFLASILVDGSYELDKEGIVQGHLGFLQPLVTEEVMEPFMCTLYGRMCI
jgi:hypothetical protein